MKSGRPPARLGVARWCSGRALWTRDRKVAGSTPGRCTAGQQLWASCSHTCASVTKQYNLVPAKGRWRSAAGQVWRHTGHASQTQWFIHLRAYDLRKGDEHPAYTPVGVCGTLYLYLLPAWKTWKSPGIWHWPGKSQGNCGLPVMCYHSCDCHKINMTRVLLSDFVKLRSDRTNCWLLPTESKSLLFLSVRVSLDFTSHV